MSKVLKFLSVMFLTLYLTPTALAESELSLVSEVEYDCRSQWQKGYDQGKADWYKKGYWKGYEKGQSEYDCSSKKSEWYNQGYADGIKHKGGYDGGYKDGHKSGYDDGYKAGEKDGWDKAKADGGGGGVGLCAFVFKFDGFINTSDLECTASDQCEDNNNNTIDVCLVKE